MTHSSSFCMLWWIRILPIDDFKRYLGGDGFAILVLVNAQLLKCALCEVRQKSHCQGASLIPRRIDLYCFMMIRYDSFCVDRRSRWRTTVATSVSVIDTQRKDIGWLKDSYVFEGHFVVLIGYDQTDDKFIYRDPASTQSYCAISTKDLDQARREEGTDHDWYVEQAEWQNGIITVRFFSIVVQLGWLKRRKLKKPDAVTFPVPPTGVNADDFRSKIVPL